MDSIAKMYTCPSCGTPFELNEFVKPVSSCLNEGYTETELANTPTRGDGVAATSDDTQIRPLTCGFDAPAVPDIS